MPKEIITNGSFKQGAAWAEVGWFRNRGVQIGVRREEDDPVTGGLYADLDREGINRLIRALRKARDQAYGADA